MSTYILVSFWMTAGGVAIGLIELMCREKWPVESKTSLGMQVAKVLIGGAFMFWAGLLLWWSP